MTIHQRTSQLPSRPQPRAGRPMPEVPGVAHRYVRTGRLRVHIAEAGCGPPVLLLHGWPQHWYAWRKLIPLLAGSYPLLHLIGPAAVRLDRLETDVRRHLDQQ